MRFAEQFGPACVGEDQVEDALDERGLPRAIGADQRGGLARRNDNVDAIEAAVRVVAFPKFLHAEGGNRLCRHPGTIEASSRIVAFSGV